VLVGVAGLLGVLIGPIGSAPSAAAASASPATVTLVSGGQSPRSKLRVAFTSGSETTAVLEMKQSVRQTIEGTPGASADVPPIRFPWSTTVDSVSATGDAQVTSRYGAATVVNDGSLSAAQEQQLVEALAPLAHVSYSARVTDRNQLFDAQVSGTEGLDPAVAETMNQVADQSSTLSVPLPREAVGVGGRWRSTITLHVSGLRITERLSFVLRSRDASGIVVDVSYQQTAPRQRADLPGVPKGAKVELTGLRGSGSGRVTMSPSEPVPVVGQSHAVLTQTFEVSQGGQHGTLEQKVTADVNVSRPDAGSTGS